MYATLRQLQTFDLAAQRCSFTQAATELGLTEATISMQIGKLAGEVGLPLFERVGRRVRLTAAGRELHAMCRDMFTAQARFEMAIADLRGLKQGELRLAAVTTAKYFVPRILGNFCKLYPDINISLDIASREKVRERLKDGADDLYVFGQPPTEFDIQALPFLANPLVAIAAPDHPLVIAPEIAFESFAGERFIVREVGSGTRNAIDVFFREQDQPLRPRLELASNEAVKQAVMGGLGVSILSRHAVDVEVADHRLVVLPVAGLPLIHHWYLVHRQDKRLSIVAQTFADFLFDPLNTAMPRQSA